MTHTIADRLAETNAKLDALLTKIAENTKASEDAKVAMNNMAIQMNQAIQEMIAKRFEVLPTELFNDPVVKAKLEQLKEQILKDLKDSFSTADAQNP